MSIYRNEEKREQQESFPKTTSSKSHDDRMMIDHPARLVNLDCAFYRDSYAIEGPSKTSVLTI